jgi:tRNA (guanine-N7-)-methyltransferase
VNQHPGYAPRPDHRPLTKFERRGIEAGRPIRDLIFLRR